MSFVSPKSHLSRSDTVYVFLACFFVGILMLTNIIGTKLFVFLPKILPEGIAGTAFVLTSGIITYPLTFLVTDVVSELWGKRRADIMVFFGFFLSLVMLGIITLAKALPPAEAWQISGQQADFFHPDHYILDPSGEVEAVDSQAAQAAFAFTFDAPGLLLFASMLAYLGAQLLDNFLFHFWRRLTKGRHLWLRNNGSTFISQFVDTMIVNGIFLHFYWRLPWLADHSSNSISIAQLIVTTYICKLLLALLDTPLIYGTVYLLRKFDIGQRQDL